MRALDRHLTIVSEAEKAALYGLPDFDDFQRAEYFAFTPEELSLAQSRTGLSGQLSCMLQIGYFRAKQAFFQFQAVITGDMHSINKVNFAIMHWFKMMHAPRFTNLEAQLKQLYCGNDPAEYEDFLIQPVGKIDRKAP